MLKLCNKFVYRGMLNVQIWTLILILKNVHMWKKCGHIIMKMQVTGVVCSWHQWNGPKWVAAVHYDLEDSDLHHGFCTVCALKCVMQCLCTQFQSSSWGQWQCW